MTPTADQVLEAAEELFDGLDGPAAAATIDGRRWIARWTLDGRPPWVEEDRSEEVERAVSPLAKHLRGQ